MVVCQYATQFRKKLMKDIAGVSGGDREALNK